LRFVTSAKGLVAAHRSWTLQPWIVRVETSTVFGNAAIVLICIAMTANFIVRKAQEEDWRSIPDTTFIAGAPSFSTADAPYFLRMATHLDDAGFHKIRLFPNLRNTGSVQQETIGVTDRPLLPVLLASLSASVDARELLSTANIMIMATSALTALMIATCFGAAGYWLEGGVAGLGGGLSAAYLVRSSIGRIDTDQLNLGFLYLIFGLVVFAGRAKTRAGCLAWSFGAGICAHLFMWWYHKPELIVMATIGLTWVMICLQRNLPLVVACTLMFLMLSGVNFFNPIDSPYLKDVLPAGQFVFSNTFETITEIKTLPIPDILRNVAGSVEMGIVCLTGLALFFVRHPVIAIAYGPLAAFALLNFVIGNRAIFYSAPILWFGAAFLMTTTARFIAARLSVGGYGVQRDQMAAIAGACLAMLVAWVNSPTDYVPRPSFPKQVLEGLASLKTTASPDNAVVATWWDYGYASMFFNDLPTFHDGGAQTSPSTHFVARAFLDHDQQHSIGTLKFLSTEGHRGIASQSTLQDLQNAFSAANNALSPDLYLVVTAQMAGWMSSISQIGNWDIETGKPIALKGNSGGPQVYYEQLNCRLAGYPRRLNCAELSFDLEHGLINGQPALAGWAHSSDGQILRRRMFDHDGDLAVQIVQTGNRISIFLLHRQLFESAFNELYHLGQIDHPSISLHYDDYPHIRIYRVNGDPDDQAR